MDWNRLAKQLMFRAWLDIDGLNIWAELQIFTACLDIDELNISAHLRMFPACHDIDKLKRFSWTANVYSLPGY